jgi:hypothetical protein
VVVRNRDHRETWQDLRWPGDQDHLLGNRASNDCASVFVFF